MTRRRQGVIGNALGAATRTQIGALVCGSIGVMLISPVPRMVLDRVTPSRLTNNPYTAVFGNAYVATGYYFLPWISLFGYVLALLSIGTLLLKGSNYAYRRHLRTRTHNNVAAGVLALALILVGAGNHPHLMPTSHEMAGAEAKMKGEDAPIATTPRSTNPTQPADFPENGTVAWGDQQPIGGDLGHLEIWDVTGSPENKVVRIRSGLIMQMPGVPGPVYATVYIRAGQRASITLPNNVPYKITAMAGREWHGTDGLFGAGATVVDFGQVMPSQDNPQVVAMGAPDQTAIVVPGNRF